MLMFICDLVEVPSLDHKIKEAIFTSLLNIAYLPQIINPLVVVSYKPKIKKFCLNTSIYLLSLTFKTFREVSKTQDCALKFLRTLARCLFAKESIPTHLHKFITEP